MPIRPLDRHSIVRDHEDRHIGLVDDRVSDAAQENPLQAAPTVGDHRDQIRMSDLGRSDDDGLRFARLEQDLGFDVVRPQRVRGG